MTEEKTPFCPDEDGYITAEELARRWHMTAKTLSNWRLAKKGPAYFKTRGKKGTVLYLMSSVKEYEKQRMHQQEA